MVGKIFSKSLLIVSFIPLLVAGILSFALFSTSKIPRPKNFEGETPGSEGLDFSLKDRLLKKIDQALAAYPKEGWDNTRELLEEVKWSCKRGSCDPEIFFNESLDSLASILINNKEFTYAASTLGILYSGNWELADVDGDQENEIAILQRDALNVKYIILKVIDFQEESRVTSYKLEGLGYFSSPNSSGVGLAPVKTLDLTGDTIPEIVLFLSPGRGGARLFAFQYQPANLKLLLKKDDLLYPEYTFSDVDKDGVLEIVVKRYSPGTRKED